MRLHTGAHAEGLAASIGARAFTVGNDIGFARGQLDPHSLPGRELLAHELTHVAQRQTGLAAKMEDGPSLSEPSEAAEIEADRVAPIVARGGRAPSIGASTPPSRVSAKRFDSISSDDIEVQRPQGLPLGEGASLVLANDAPASVIESMEEGESYELFYRGVEAAGSGSLQMVLASTQALGESGFAPAGPNAIGLVVEPRFGPYLGHTALYVRRGGLITMVRGFNPDMQTLRGLINVLTHREGMEKGTFPVASRITNDAGMFGVSNARTVEWPFSSKEILKFESEMPKLGLHSGQPPYYNASPAKAGNPSTIQNCGLWAIRKIERAFNVVVGRPGGGSILDAGKHGTAPNTAHQPSIVSMVAEGDVAPLDGRPATVGGMSRTMRILRIGGKVFFVVGLVSGVAEIARAKPGQGKRTAVGVGGGFVGGFIAGAAGGLLCGPGAPVCSFLAGFGLGIFGSIAGRSIALDAYDGKQGPSKRYYPGVGVCPACHNRGGGPSPALLDLQRFVQPASGGRAGANADLIEWLRAQHQ